MKHSINYYMYLLSEGCDACGSYNEIGGCGTWSSFCHVAEEKAALESFMNKMYLDFDSLVALFEFDELWDNVVPAFYAEEDIIMKEIFDDMEADYWIGVYNSEL